VGSPRASRLQRTRPALVAPATAPRQRAARRGSPPPCQRGTRGGRSLNQLICPPQQRRRDRQAERLGGLEVDDQLELRRLLYGEIGGFRALEDLVDVAGGASE